MDDGLTVSVALCTHNGERFLSTQLKSILNQTHRPREIVLSDDASTDGTVQLVTATIAAHNAEHPTTRVELLVLQNKVALGVTKNFEQAILACTSNLVALCDQDDVWAVNKLERMSTVFVGRPELLLLHSDARLIDEAGDPLPGTLLGALEISNDAVRAIHMGNAFGLLLRRNFTTGATVMIRRRFASQVAPFPDAWVHDEWLAITASVFGEIDVIEECLIDYRQHGSNQIGAVKLSIVGKFYRMVEPGYQRNHRLLARSESLVDRFELLSGQIPASVLTAVHEKLSHEQVRASLPISRVKRVAAVVRELRNGRYTAYGRGFWDAIRDLSQPLNPGR
jgi:glycosyltransferase involved in cell wall biosynthesis